METVLTLTEVALKSLTVSPLNVRKTNLDEDIKALAADIDAHGLKQNLVVVPSLVDGRYEVVAGGRRLHALMHLVDEGRLPFDAPIPVRVEARDEGRPTSLSENLHRVAMNPADEFIAYRTIVEEHADEPDPVAYCSRRFGVSRAHVEGRLRLASLAPDILDAMRDGKLNVESAKAYASLADHKLQITVFTAEEKKTWGVKHEPRSVRDALKLKTLSVACAQAVYVGIEVYRQAGGRIELEMFLGSEGGERIVDPSLLDKLAREKIAAELPKLAKKDGFASALPAAGFGQYPAWPKAPAGMERAYDYGLDRTALPKELKKESTAVYRLADDGSGLILYGRFKPSAAATPEPTHSRPPAASGGARRALTTDPPSGPPRNMCPLAVPADDLPARHPARRRFGDRLRIAPARPLRLRPPGAAPVRLEDAGRHLRCPDLRRLRHVAGAGQGSVPDTRRRLPGLEGGPWVKTPRSSGRTTPSIRGRAARNAGPAARIAMPRRATPASPVAWRSIGARARRAGAPARPIGRSPCAGMPRRPRRASAIACSARAWRTCSTMPWIRNGATICGA